MREGHLELELNARISTPRRAWIPAVVGGAASILLGSLHPALFWLAAAVTALLTFKTHQADVLARTTHLVYEPEALHGKRAEALASALDGLRSTQGLWVVDTQARTSDWKRNAGANTLVSRRPITASRRLPRYVQTTATVLTLELGTSSIHFLPDRILVWDGRRYAAAEYSTLILRQHETDFIESGRPPSDAPVVGHTWLYTNKNGGPDRRFNNNRQLPVMRYGVVELGSRAGFAVHIQTSNPAAAARVFSSLEAAAAAD